MIVVVSAACGGGKKSGGSGSGSGSVAPPPPELAVPALGVDAPKRMNYLYDAGQKEYDKVLKAYKAQPRDWAAVQATAEATVAKDAGHLDAQWVLGEALAQAGDGAKAAEHLSIALAGDWLRWGPDLDKDPELAGFLATPYGKALLALDARLKEQFAAEVKAAPLVLGRRSTFKLPGPGANPAYTRGELYAYDVASKRFLRLTHTDHQLAAYLRSPAGDELLLAGFDKAELADAKKNKDAAPLLARSWVKTFSLTTLDDTSARATIGKGRVVTAWYGAGDQVVVATAPADGRWGAGKPTQQVLDRSTGKLTKTQIAAPDGAVIEMTFDEVVVRGPGLTAPPKDIDPTLMAKLMSDGGGPIAVAEGGTAKVSSFTMSPGKTRLAFATETDPCNDADDAAKPTLYVADKTAAIKHVLTASSRFAVAWIDEDHLVYEDGSGGVRLYDAAAQRESAKVAGGPGLAVRALSPTTAPLCHKEPIAAEPDTGSDLPPEESPAVAPI